MKQKGKEEMPCVNYNCKEYVDVNIELKGIGKDIFRKIQNYIEEIIAGGNAKHEELAHENAEDEAKCEKANSENVTVISAEEDIPSCDPKATETNVPEGMYVSEKEKSDLTSSLELNIPKTRGAKEIYERFQNAEKNPKIYEYKWMKAEEAQKEIETLSDCDKQEVAYALGILSHCGASKRKKLYDEANKRYRIYYIFPCKIDKTIAERIKSAREKAGLTIRELSDLIEYDENVIEKWEKGEYEPSVDAFGTMKRLFGYSL